LIIGNGVIVKFTARFVNGLPCLPSKVYPPSLWRVVVGGAKSKGLLLAPVGGIIAIQRYCGRNSVVECRLPKPEKPKTASICPSSTYIKPHFQAKTELDSDNTVELTSE